VLLCCYAVKSHKPHREMVAALRGEGLVVLGLSAQQYRQLGTLREAAGLLSPDLDALRYDRCSHIWLLAAYYDRSLID
jgi:hypothetical protein